MRATRHYYSQRAAHELLLPKVHEKGELNQRLRPLGLEALGSSAPLIQALAKCVEQSKAENSEGVRNALEELATHTGPLSTQQVLATAGLLASVVPEKNVQFRSFVFKEVAWSLGKDAFGPLPDHENYLSTGIEFSPLVDRTGTLGFRVADVTNAQPQEIWIEIELAMKAYFFDSLPFPIQMLQTAREQAAVLVEKLQSQRGQQLVDSVSSSLSRSKNETFDFLCWVIEKLTPEVSYDILFDSKTIQKLNNITSGSGGAVGAAKAFLSGELDSGARADVIEIFKAEPFLRRFVTHQRHVLPYGQARASKAAVENFKKFRELALKKPPDKDRLFEQLNLLMKQEGLEDLAQQYDQELREDSYWFFRRLELNDVFIFISEGKRKRLVLEELDQFPLNEVFQALVPWFWTLGQSDDALSGDQATQRKCLESLLLRGDYLNDSKFVSQLRALVTSPVGERNPIFEEHENQARQKAQALLDGLIKLEDCSSPGVEKLSRNAPLATRQELIAASRFLLKKSLEKGTVDKFWMSKFINILKDLPRDALDFAIKEWCSLDPEQASPQNAAVSMELRLQVLAGCSVLKTNALGLLIDAFTELSEKQKKQFRDTAASSSSYRSLKDKKNWGYDQKQNWAKVPGETDSDKSDFLSLLQDYEDACNEIQGFDATPQTRQVLIKTFILANFPTVGNISSLVEKNGWPQISPLEKRTAFHFVLNSARFSLRNGTTLIKCMLTIAQELDREFPNSRENSHVGLLFQAIAKRSFGEALNGQFFARTDLLLFAKMCADQDPKVAIEMFRLWKELDAQQLEDESEQYSSAQYKILSLKYHLATTLNRDDLVSELLASLTESQRKQIRSALRDATNRLHGQMKFPDECFRRAVEKIENVLPGAADNIKSKFVVDFVTHESINELPPLEHVRESFRQLVALQLGGKPAENEREKARELVEKLDLQEQVIVLEKLMSRRSPFRIDKLSIKEEFAWHTLFSQWRSRAVSPPESGEPAKVMQSPGKSSNLLQRLRRFVGDRSGKSSGSKESIFVTEQQANKFQRALLLGAPRVSAVAQQGFPGLHAASLRTVVRVTALQFDSAVYGYFKNMVLASGSGFVRQISYFSAGLLSDQELIKIAASQGCSPDELLLRAQSYALEKYKSFLEELNRPVPNIAGQPTYQDKGEIVRAFFNSVVDGKFFLTQMAEFLYGKNDAVAIEELLQHARQLDSGVTQVKTPTVLSRKDSEVLECLHFIESELPGIQRDSVERGKIRKESQRDALPASVAELNVAGVAKFFKSSASRALHFKRASLLSESVNVEWSHNLNDYDYRHSINRIVQRSFESLYLSACALNNGKPATAETMNEVRNDAVNFCAQALKSFLTHSRQASLDLTKINAMKVVMAEAIAKAFTQHQLSTASDTLIKRQKIDLLELKVTLHDVPLLGEMGVAERLLRVIQKAQRKLPEQQQIPPKIFELLRAALRLQGGAFQSESEDMRRLAREDENIALAMQVKSEPSMSDAKLRDLSDEIRRISASLMLGVKYGGEKEVVVGEETSRLGVVDVLEQPNHPNNLASYLLSDVETHQIMLVSSETSQEQLQRNELMRSLLASMPPELTGIANIFLIHSNPDAEGVLGQAIFEQKLVAIFPNAFDSVSKVAHTLFHELGHFVFDRLSQPKTSRRSSVEGGDWGTGVAPQSAWLKRFCDAVEADGLMDTAYGSKNPSEAFCERFALYYSSRSDSSRHALLRRMYPHTFAMLDEVRKTLIDSRNRVLERQSAITLDS